MELNEDHIRQLLRGDRGIGDDMAEKLEMVAGKDRYWMDQLRGVTEPGAEYITHGGGNDKDREEWNAIYDRLSPSHRAQMRAIGNTFAEPTEQDTMQDRHPKEENG